MNASRRGCRAAVILPVSIGAIAAAISMASPASACDDGCGPGWQQPGYQQPWQNADWDSNRWGQPWQPPPPPPPPQQWEPDWWWHADYYEARKVPRDPWGNLDPAYAGVTIRFSGRFGTDYFVCDRPGWRLEERGSKVYYVSDYWNR